MSYRARRARSRTPPARLRAEAASSTRASGRASELKSGRPVSISPPFRKRSRERDDAKRNRWETERNRNKGRSRSPRSRINSRRTSSPDSKRPVARFEPPEPPFIGPQHSPNGKYLGFSVPPPTAEWREPNPNVTKFSPPSRFSPVRFPTLDYGDSGGGSSSMVESAFNTNDGSMWRQNELRVGDDGFGNQNLSTVPATGPLPLMGLPQLMGSNLMQDFAPASNENKLEDSGPSVPEFNPESSKIASDEWIKLIETTAIERDWKSDEKLYVVSSRLAGFARQWYLNTGMKCKNWSELKSAFLVAFPSENDYYYLLKKMFERVKQDRESMTAYFHHKVALLNACDIYGRKAVSCIVGGLPTGKLKDDSKCQNFDDPDLLYQFLRTYTDPPKKEPLPKIKIEDNKKMPEKKQQEDVCSFCKKPGHRVGSCEHKFNLLEREAQRYAELADKGLVMCNNVMHGSLSQAPTFNKYFTDVAINGIPIRGYVDQSSKSSTIREENAQFLKLPFRKQSTTIYGFGGNPVSAYGYVEVPICIDRAIANVKLYIVPNFVQVIPIVVGQNFTEQPHVVVMKDDEKIRFYQRMDNGQTNFDF